MKTSIRLALALSCAIALQAQAQTQATPAQPLSCQLPTMNQVAYSQVTELIASKPTSILNYGDDALQYAELWLPNDAPPSGVPLVIFIHGGCWLSEYDIRHSQALSTALSESGYAVYAVEYRRSGDPGGGWPGSLHDIVAAIKSAQLLDHQTINLDKIALVGHSAGGHLALLAGHEFAGQLSAVIGLAAIVDLEQYSKGANSCQAAVEPFVGGNAVEKAQVLADASPSNQTLHPHTLLIHGSEDNIVSVEQAMQSGLPTRVIQGAGHFDLIHPATAAYQQLLKELAIAFR